MYDIKQDMRSALRIEELREAPKMLQHVPSALESIYSCPSYTLNLESNLNSYL